MQGKGATIVAQRRLEDNRKAYVRFKIQVLKDCCLPLPPKEDIERLIDKERTPLLCDVDAYFHQRLINWK